MTSQVLLEERDSLDMFARTNNHNSTSSTTNSNNNNNAFNHQQKLLSKFSPEVNYFVTEEPEDDDDIKKVLAKHEKRKRKPSLGRKRSFDLDSPRESITSSPDIVIPIIQQPPQPVTPQSQQQQEKRAVLGRGLSLRYATKFYEIDSPTDQKNEGSPTTQQHQQFSQSPTSQHSIYNFEDFDDQPPISDHQLTEGKNKAQPTTTNESPTTTMKPFEIASALGKAINPMLNAALTVTRAKHKLTDRLEPNRVTTLQPPPTINTQLYSRTPEINYTGSATSPSDYVNTDEPHQMRKFKVLPSVSNSIELGPETRSPLTGIPKRSPMFECNEELNIL